MVVTWTRPVLQLQALCLLVHGSTPVVEEQQEQVALSRLSPLCSMAGHHDNGQCTCLEGWRGDRCSVLDLVPVPSVAAIQAWAPRGRASWGGTVLPDPSDGKVWHMFAAVMDGSLSLSKGWEGNSTIEHLVSATGEPH